MNHMKSANSECWETAITTFRLQPHVFRDTPRLSWEFLTKYLFPHGAKIKMLPDPEVAMNNMPDSREEHVECALWVNYFLLSHVSWAQQDDWKTSYGESGKKKTFPGMDRWRGWVVSCYKWSHKGHQQTLTLEGVFFMFAKIPLSLWMLPQAPRPIRMRQTIRVARKHIGCL